MTIETYNKATKILEEKKQLEDKLFSLARNMTGFYNTQEYDEICAKLFELGQEFAML